MLIRDRSFVSLLGVAAAGAVVLPGPAVAVATATAEARAGAVTVGPNIDIENAGLAFTNALISDAFGNNGSGFAEVSSLNGQSEGQASADFIGAGRGEAAFDVDVTNNTPVARTYKFKFAIDAGTVDVEFLNGYLGGDAEAAFSVQIFATYEGNTATLFETGYTVKVDDGETIINAGTGTDIGFTALNDGRIGVRWDQYVGTVTIPFAIQPGESFNFDYLLTASAFSDGVDPEAGYGNPGGISALTNAADPNQITPDDIGFSSAPVPAPATALVLAAGLAGLGGARRRRVR